MSDSWEPDKGASNNEASGFAQNPPQSVGRGRLYKNTSEEKNVTWPSNNDSSGGNWNNKSNDDRNDGNGGFGNNKDNSWNKDSGRGGGGFNNRDNRGFNNRDNRGRGGFNRGGDRPDYNNSRQQWGDKKTDDNGEEGFNKNGDDDGNRNRGGFGGNRRNYGDRQNRDDDRQGGYRNRNEGGGGYGGRNRDNGDGNDEDRGRGGFRNENRSRGFGGQNRDGGGFGGQNRDGGGFGGQNRDGGGFGDQNKGGGGSWGQNEDGGGKWGQNNDRDGGGFGGNNRDGDSGGNKGRSGFGGQNRDGGGFNDRNNRDRGENKDGEEERPPPYCPALIKDEDLFDESIPCGINFKKYKDKQHAKLSGNNPIAPINSFEEAKLRQHLVENIKKAHYDSPTTVQQYVIPVIMANRDIMACAQTGSGKTAAFLLPILHNLMRDGVESMENENVQEPSAIIVAPTRELVMQIHKEATKFALGAMVRVGLLYGGTSTGYQLRNIRERGAHIVVATPGRLNDVIEKGAIALSKLRYLVLDEADRMLDMGFLECINKIVEHPSITPKGERNTLMFSATFPVSVQKVANQFLTDYLFLTIGFLGGANDDVNQTFAQADGRSTKNDKLVELLTENFKKESVIVFVQEKRIADFVCSILCQAKLDATSIHGDRHQHQREQALYDFRTGKFSILVATGVASRGLDIKGVDHVINYDMPHEIDEYVHRIGRTARVGNVGKSTSFVDPKFDAQIIPALITILKNAEQEIPDWLAEIGGSTGDSGNSRQTSHYGGRDYRSTDEKAEWDKPSNSGGGGGPAAEDACWD